MARAWVRGLKSKDAATIVTRRPSTVNGLATDVNSIRRRWDLPERRRCSYERRSRSPLVAGILTSKVGIVDTKCHPSAPPPKKKERPSYMYRHVECHDVCCSFITDILLLSFRSRVLCSGGGGITNFQSERALWLMWLCFVQFSVRPDEENAHCYVYTVTLSNFVVPTCSVR